MRQLKAGAPGLKMGVVIDLCCKSNKSRIEQHLSLVVSQKTNNLS